MTVPPLPPTPQDDRPHPTDSGWQLPWEDFPLGRKAWEEALLS
jgi:hypothetical protein